MLNIDSTPLEDGVFQGRHGYSPLYEYSLILFAFAAFFALSAGSNKLTTLLALCLVYLIIRDFSFGHRVLGVQLSLLLYVLYGYKLYNFTKMLSAFALFVVFMTILGTLRKYGFDPRFIIDHISNNYFSFDTIYYSYINSLQLLHVADSISLFDRLNAFYFFIANIFVKSSFPTVFSYLLNYGVNLGGAVAPLYGSFYLSFFWPILLSLWLGFILLNTFTFKTKLRSIIFIYLFISSPRWLLYSVAPLTKHLLVILFIYVVFLQQEF